MLGQSIFSVSFFALCSLLVSDIQLIRRTKGNPAHTVYNYKSSNSYYNYKAIQVTYMHSPSPILFGINMHSWSKLNTGKYTDRKNVCKSLTIKTRTLPAQVPRNVPVITLRGYHRQALAPALELGIISHCSVQSKMYHKDGQRPSV